MEKINKSKTYILPLLDDYVRIKFLDHILNTYLITDETKEPSIHILYDISVKNNPAFNSYFVLLHQSQYFISSKDIDEGVLISFKIPKEYIPDYNKFIKGAYSLISEKSKQKILHHLYKNYSYLYNVVQVIEHVLYKDEELKHHWEETIGTTLSKNSELSSRVDLKEETYISSI